MIRKLNKRFTNYLLVNSKKLGHYILSEANETILAVTKGLTKPFLARSAREFFPSATYWFYHVARLWATVSILLKVLSQLISYINVPSSAEVLVAVLMVVYSNVIYRVTIRIFNKN